MASLTGPVVGVVRLSWGSIESQQGGKKSKANEHRRMGRPHHHHPLNGQLKEGMGRESTHTEIVPRRGLLTQLGTECARLK